MINRTFRASDEHELPSFDAARAQGIKAALAIGSDEIVSGTPFFAAEVVVGQGDEMIARFIVAIGASPIQ